MKVLEREGYARRISAASTAVAMDVNSLRVAAGAT